MRIAKAVLRKKKSSEVTGERATCITPTKLRWHMENISISISYTENLMEKYSTNKFEFSRAF